MLKKKDMTGGQVDSIMDHRRDDSSAEQQDEERDVPETQPTSVASSELGKTQPPCSVIIILTEISSIQMYRSPREEPKLCFKRPCSASRRPFLAEVW